MRLFTGIDLPTGIEEALSAVIAHLRPAAPIRWSKAANFHITTKFIGEWPEGRLEELKSALAGVAKSGAIPIEIKGLGWFPNPHQPRVFWSAVHAPQSLRDLAAATDSACAGLGISRETKPYTPHLTLARIEPRGGGPAPDLGALRRAIAGLPVAPFGAFEARAFHLYLSEQRDGGSHYTRLATFPLE